MIKELLARLPNNVFEQILSYRRRYADAKNRDMRNEIGARMGGYVLGLHDAGLITETERQKLYVYMTV